MSNYEETFENIERYLKKSNHNIVAKNIAGSCNGFLCESITDKYRFFIKIRIDNNLDYVIVETFPMISVPEAFRTMAAEFCVKKSDEQKIGYLCVDPDYGDFYSHLETSFEYGVVTPETVEKMESISVASLAHCYDEMQCIARGVLQKSKKTNDLERDFISRMAAELGVDTDDSDDENDNEDSGKEPFPDISALLSGLDEKFDEEAESDT